MQWACFWLTPVSSLLRSPYVCLADEIQERWWAGGRRGIYQAGNDFTISFLMTNISGLKAAVVWKISVYNLSPREAVEATRGRGGEAVMPLGRVTSRSVQFSWDSCRSHQRTQSGRNGVFPASCLITCSSPNTTALLLLGCLLSFQPHWAKALDSPELWVK